MRQPFLVAKYVADVRRMEPRNIGIVLWVRGRVGYRFLPTKDATFIDDKTTYERWVEYWTLEIEQPVIRDYKARQDYPKTKPEFLDGLRTKTKPSYLLYDGGEVIDKVPMKELAAAVDYLFGELVAVAQPRRKTKMSR